VCHKKVPYTVCREQQYTVCKKVPYTVTKQVPYTVCVKVPYTVTENVPTTVCKKVPVCTMEEVCVKKWRRVACEAAPACESCQPSCGCEKEGWLSRLFRNRFACNSCESSCECGSSCGGCGK
jgi:hypothetical protein